jgi:hypothetical protein
LKYRTGQIVVTITTLIAALSLTCHASISSPGSPPPGDDLSQIDQVAIKRIAPERAGGQGYQLVYRVKLPIALYWEFKTDFDNSFLIENKFIRAHRFISQAGNVAITENKYKHGPDVFFRWRTTLSPETFRLDFILLNPGQCHQKYHYGYIQLKSEGEYTRVIQVAYFDFWGASFWAHYPWQGGMKDFLTYTARWEQATALRFGNRYRDANDPKE